jgi:hypothetical protein
VTRVPWHLLRYRGEIYVKAESVAALLRGLADHVDRDRHVDPDVVRVLRAVRDELHSLADQTDVKAIGLLSEHGLDLDRHG